MGHKKRRFSKLVMAAAALQIAVPALMPGAVSADTGTFGNVHTVDSFAVSPGVTYEHKAYEDGDTKQKVHVMGIDLTNQYADIEVGIADPLNQLITTSEQMKIGHEPGHFVVGGVNASFFNYGTESPVSLIAKNNEIINYGVIVPELSSPMNEPFAFGITETGTAQIKDFDASLIVQHPDLGSFELTGMNTVRQEEAAVLYTPSYYEETTGATKWGIEIIVENASGEVDDFAFGDTISGTVAAVTKFGEPGNSVIPDDGFVISVHSQELAEKFSGVDVGEPIQVGAAIDEAWQDAEFILGSGPRLIKDGQININIDENSWFASGASPRTAVAVNKAGTKVFMVAIDGRQPGYSEGVSLRELAEYLRSLGAYQAINLDGGGSTAMAVRFPGQYYATLANKPSDGVERAVSSTLKVISETTVGKAETLKTTDVPATVFTGGTIDLEVAYARDAALNPVEVDQEGVTYRLEGKIGTLTDGTFKATTPGQGTIIVSYQNAEERIPLTVKERPVTVLLEDFEQREGWEADSARAETEIRLSSGYEPVREQSKSLQMVYDFTVGPEGIKASYAESIPPIPLSGRPLELGVWVYGDNSNHWLRGTVTDGEGQTHTIDFTEEDGLNWTGWRYLTAEIPADISLPLTFNRIYVAETNPDEQDKGTLYFDKLQAVYVEDYKEPRFRDLEETYWAYEQILFLNDRGIINGYLDGTVRPKQEIKRIHAAMMLERALGLTASPGTGPEFADVTKETYGYATIAAVAEAGLFTGDEQNRFNPNETLTRAEMAVILQRAYDLAGEWDGSFEDMDADHWAYEAVEALAANDVAGGYPDGTYRPNAPITRAEFSAFMYRVIN